MKLKTTTSISDFKKYRKDNYYYVDKTLLIKELFDKGDQVTLLPRPRRFGKTLNLSMLKYYFDIRENSKELFKGLNIEKSNLYEKHINKYPVISLTFKDSKGEDWDKCYRRMKDEIRREYREHKYLLDSNKLDERDKKYINRTLDEEDIDYPMSVKELSRLLYQHYGKEVVILIDEYDTPINNLLDKDYYNKVIEFLRDMISSCFKDNKYLYKGIITGILRIAKESIFSGANNIMVRTILDNDFSDKFGFNEIEVVDMLKYNDIEDNINEVRNWHNGYTFGNNTLYNPYPIANYVQKKSLEGYWINSGNNALIENLLIKLNTNIKDKLEELIKGNSIEEDIAEDIVFSEINKNPKYLWNLLLFSGYFKASKNYNGKYILSIPNKEIKIFYNKLMEKYFTELIPELVTIMDKISLSIFNDDIKSFREEIKNLLISKLSSYDIGKNKENVYHVIILLSLLRLEYNNEYEVKSNIESGEGRYDISIIPKDINKKGYIIEIKVAKSEKGLKKKAEEAIKQIEKNKYATELKNRGIKNIVMLGIAFQGKNVYIIDKEF